MFCSDSNLDSNVYGFRLCLSLVGSSWFYFYIIGTSINRTKSEERRKQCDKYKIFSSNSTDLAVESMITSSNRNIFRVTGPSCGKFTCLRWIPLTKACDEELWCFLWSAPWINGWVNNREAGDLRRHRAHYDIVIPPIIDRLQTHNPMPPFTNMV